MTGEAVAVAPGFELLAIGSYYITAQISARMLLGIS